MIESIDGYVGDTQYPSQFHAPLQPAWVDAALTLNGIAAPRGTNKHFTLIDLGCGDAIGLLLTAASHPEGRFVGVDAMPAHIERGQELCDRLGLTNVTLHCAGFADCGGLADGKADYVTAHGVLAWVSEANRSALMNLASNWLRPGGALMLSYNSWPGWSRIAPFQAMIRAIAMALEGSSSDRFRRALAIAKDSGTLEPEVLEWVEEKLPQFEPTYFAHEYLNAHWRPCWSGEVIAAMAEYGLGYVGQISGARLRPDLALKSDWRTEIARLPGLPAREIAADIFAGTWFRRDLYMKPPARTFATADELAAARLDGWWGLSEDPTEELSMHAETPAGSVDFDNPAARAILASLARGPVALAEIANASSIGVGDLANSCDALWIAGKIIPLNPPGDAARATAANAALRNAGVRINGEASAWGARSA